MNSRFYFDHNATTPVAPEVLDAFTRAARDTAGNPSSIHQTGQHARQALEAARREVAALLGCPAGDVVFVSGGTEADNLAVLGEVGASERLCKHVVTTAIEHPAVLGACQWLEKQGVEVSYIAPGPDGAVHAEDIAGALRPETVLVSVMHANNETGVLQPVEEIARLAREAGIPFHSDGVQAAGKVDLAVEALGADYYSISAHKLYAPKGCGALYVRRGSRLAPLFHGGRHERGRRPGTENVPGAVAFGAAAQRLREHGAEERQRVERLRDRLEQAILAEVPHTTVNGAGAPRVANTSNLRFDGIEGEAMVIALDLQGFAVSTGSACSSGAVEPSHVLLAMGLSADQARSSLRFSLGRDNDEQQVNALIQAVAAAAARLRKLSPVYTTAD